MGLKSTPIRVACGTASFNISSCLATSSVSSTVSPVMLPPGRARLATCPTPTGSAWVANTMGIVLVACRAASTSVEDSREDDVDIHADQLGRQLRQLVDRFRPPELNDNVLALDIAEFAQARPQCLDPVSASRGGTNRRNPIAASPAAARAPRAAMLPPRRREA